MTTVFQYMKMMMQLVVDKNNIFLYSLNVSEDDDDIVHFANNIAVYDIGMRKISMGISRKPGFLKSFIISASKLSVAAYITTYQTLEPDNDYVKYFLATGPLMLKSSKGILDILSFDDELSLHTTTVTIDISENAILVEVKNTQLHNASLTLLKFTSEKVSESNLDNHGGNHDQKSSFWLALDNDKIYNYITLISNNSSEHVNIDHANQNKFSEKEWRHPLDGKDRIRNINIPNVCAQIPYLNSYGERCTCFAYLEQLVDYDKSNKFQKVSEEIDNIILFFGESDGSIHRQQYGKPLLSRKLSGVNAEITSETKVTAMEFPVNAIEVVSRGGERSSLLVVSIATNVFIIDSNHFELYAEYTNVGIMKLIINDLKPQLYMIPSSEEQLSISSSSIFSKPMTEEIVANIIDDNDDDVNSIRSSQQKENTVVCQTSPVMECESLVPTTTTTTTTTTTATTTSTTTTNIIQQLERKEVIVKYVIADLPWEGFAAAAASSSGGGGGGGGGYNRINVMNKNPRDILGLVDLQVVFYSQNRKRKDDIDSIGAKKKKKGKKKKKLKVNDISVETDQEIQGHAQEAKGQPPVDIRYRSVHPSMQSLPDAGQLRSTAFFSLLSVLQSRHRKAMASSHILRQSLSSRYSTLWALRRLLIERVDDGNDGSRGTVTAAVSLLMLPTLKDVASNMFPVMTQPEIFTDKGHLQIDHSSTPMLPPASLAISQAGIQAHSISSSYGINGDGISILHCSYTIHPADSTIATSGLYSPRLLMVCVKIRNDTRVTVHDIMLTVAHISPPPLPSPVILSADTTTIPSLNPNSSSTLTMILTLPACLFSVPYTMSGVSSSYYYQQDYSSTTRDTLSDLPLMVFSIGLQWLMKCPNMKGEEACCHNNQSNINYRHTSRFLDETVSLSVNPLINCIDISKSYRRFGKGVAILKMDLSDLTGTSSSSSSSSSSSRRSRSYHENRQSEYSTKFASVDKWRAFPFLLAHKNVMNLIHPLPQDRPGNHHHHYDTSKLSYSLPTGKVCTNDKNSSFDFNRLTFARCLSFRLISRHHHHHVHTKYETSIDKLQIQSMSDKIKHILNNLPHPLLKVINYNSTNTMDSEAFYHKDSDDDKSIIDQTAIFDDIHFNKKVKQEKHDVECFPSGIENALLILESASNHYDRYNNDSVSTKMDQNQYIDGRLYGLYGAALTINLTPLVAHLERNEVSFRVTLEDHEVATLLESAVIMRSEVNYLASQWKKELIRRRERIPRPRPLRSTSLPTSRDDVSDCHDRNESLIAVGPRLCCTLSDAVNMLYAQKRTDYSVSHAMFIVRSKRDILNMFTVYSQIR